MSKFDELYESIMNMGSEDELAESINDKNLFKAVFLAGGPGSGKSFIVDRMFSGLDAKLLNSDTAFEHLLAKKGLSKKIDPKKADVYAQQMVARKKAKGMTSKQKGFWVDGMLPVIIDGTGKDYDKIKKEKDMLDNLGYDTHMVFVNTTLDVAHERNKMRERSVPDKVVEDSWNAVQSNIGKFQNTFKDGFVVVDNSKTLSSDEVKKLGETLRKKAIKFFNGKVKNRRGQDVIDLLKKTGGKYLSDLTEI